MSIARAHALTNDLIEQLGLRADSAVDELLPILYGELRTLARRHLRRERADHTLQTTALVHEAYLRLRDQLGVEWQGRAHFFAIASMMIRRILVDHAKSRGRLKRDPAGSRSAGSRPNGLRVPLTGLAEVADVAVPEDVDLVSLDGVLESFSRDEPRKAQVVQMRFFGGMSVDEVAEVLGVTARTVERDWQYARAWLYRAVKDARDPPQAKDAS